MKFTSPRYTLIRTGYDNDKIQHEFKAETLTELLEYIENFIRGSGFYIEGERLDFVSDEDDREDIFSFDRAHDLGLSEDTITLTGVDDTQYVDIDLNYDLGLEPEIDLTDSITINLDETYGTTSSYMDEKVK